MGACIKIPHMDYDTLTCSWFPNGGNIMAFVKTVHSQRNALLMQQKNCLTIRLMIGLVSKSVYSVISILN